MNKDPYEILGLSRNCSLDDITAAYRKLVKQYHPDRNIGDPDAEKKFKEVQEAYDVLNDPSRKSHFDQFGFSASGDWTQNFTQTMHDFFSKSSFKGRNIQIKIDVTLEEIAIGCKKKITFNRSKICNDCSGSGSKSIKECHNCNGSGIQFVRIQPNFNLQSACNVCNGSGKITAEMCATCSGSGFQKEQEVANFEVPIPAGSADGMMKIANQGEPSRDKKGSSGDLIVLINLLKHEIFQRHDNHIVIDVPCTFSQLCRGVSLEIPTVYKEKIVTRIPAGTYPNSQIRIAGKGLPGGRNAIGDMYIIPKLDVPKNITEEYNELLNKLSELDEKNTSKRRLDWLEKIKKYNT